MNNTDLLVSKDHPWENRKQVVVVGGLYSVGPFVANLFTCCSLSINSTVFPVSKDQPWKIESRSLFIGGLYSVGQFEANLFT